jgi:hypothetical protein
MSKVSVVALSCTNTIPENSGKASWARISISLVTLFETMGILAVTLLANSEIPTFFRAFARYRFSALEMSQIPR